MHISNWKPPGMEEQEAQDRAFLRPSGLHGATGDRAMLNHSSHAAKAGGPRTFRDAMKAMRPARPIIWTPPRRWPGPRLGEAATGILLLLAILAAVCAYLLLLDHLGVSPEALTDFPLID